MYKQLAKYLQNICSDLDKKYDTNSGACFYIAYLIMKNCKKYGVPYKIKYWYDSNDPEDCDEYNIYHASIEINGIDTNPDEIAQEWVKSPIEKYVDKSIREIGDIAKDCLADSGYFKISNKSKVKREIDRIFAAEFEQGADSQIYETIMSAISKEVKKALFENELDEDWKSSLKNIAAGTAIAVSTLGGMTSCQTKSVNEPSYEQIVNNKQTDIVEETVDKMLKDNSFLQKAKDELKNGEDLIYDKIDQTSSSTINPDGNYVFVCIHKSNGEIKSNIFRTNSKSIFDSNNPYDIVNWYDSDSFYDEHENCKVSPYTKFYEQYEWENGMERIYDTWITNAHKYWVQTIKCDDSTRHKFHVENHEVKDKETYIKYREQGEAAKGMVFDINDILQ